MAAKNLLRACSIVILIGILMGQSLAQTANAAPLAQGDPAILVYGETVNGEISPVTPTQTYAFEAQANDVVTVTMTATGGDLDPFVALTDVLDVQLATDDDSGGENNARLAFVIPNTGRYLIQASHAGGMLPTAGGQYALSLTAVSESGVIVERTPPAEPTSLPDPTDLPDGTSDQQGVTTRLLPIAPDAPLEDELTRQIAFRLYWFQLEDSRPITVIATSQEAFTPLLTLYDASFTEIARAQPTERLTIQPDAGGVYLIGVSLPEAGSAGGSYTLALDTGETNQPVATEHSTPTPDSGETPAIPDDFLDLPPIAPNVPVEGALDDQHFMDIYTFLGAAGQTIVVEMTSLNGEEANGLDPFLLLLDDTRIPLEEHDDIVAGVERDARLSYTLPRTAYYAIVATRFDQEAGTSAGPYELMLTFASADGLVAESATPLLETELLRPNVPVQATFDNTPDAYRFEAQAGELIDLSITADPGVDPVLILATDTLSEIVSSGSGALTGLRTPATGTYYLVVAMRFGPVGTPGGYILALNQPGDRTSESDAESPESDELDAGDDALTDPVASETLTYGQTLSGVIDDQTPSRVYTLNGTAGERVRLTLRAAEGSALDPYLELRDGDGAVLDANDDIDPGVVRDAQVIAELPADGPYQVLVSRYVGPDADITSGAYELTVEAAGEEETALAPVNTAITPLSYGQTHMGEINNDQFLLFYAFTGAANDRVTIEVDQLSGNVDAILHLYQAAGESWTQLAYNDDSPNGGTYDPLLSDVTLPASGTYLIAVGRYGLEKEADMIGTFSITLTRQP